MMAIKVALKNSLFATVAVVGVMSSFYAIIDLMIFLSWRNLSTRNTSKNGTDDEDNWKPAFWSLFVNQILLSAFALQHSLMTLPKVKDLFKSLKIETIERSVYVIASAFALQALIRNWHVVPYFTLWEYHLSRSSWWTFFIVHSFCWTIFYVGNICMDITELLGIKQVYYSIKGFPEPNYFKSAELKRLHGNMRHPSFLTFLIILWIIPVMSLDRLLLASFLSAYMYLAWTPDERDYRYQKIQYTKKFIELKHYY